jgi:hypothetical protein
MAADLRASRQWLFALGISGSIAAGIGIGRCATRVTAPPPQRTTVKSIAVMPPTTTCAAIDPAPAPIRTPTLVDVADERIQRREKALAHELAAMWTRDPDALVRVLDHASRSDPDSPPVTLLLAIAHAETNGQILDVSEAGAVGLAQATPVACRQEKFDGKLFVTNDYLAGSRAYITKKPLGDADTIASNVLAHDTKATRARAKRLLTSAIELRREGLDELDLLEPFAPDGYYEKISAADEHSRKVLEELHPLLEHGSRKQLLAFRDRTRREYRQLKSIQLSSWRRYQLELAAKRDQMLVHHFGMSADLVKKTMAYEAGEWLGQELDERFSATRMADFLVKHLESKAKQARHLAGKRNVEEMTAALYNGGSHNVKRMLAGLIASLPETQRYMKKVPATRRRLDVAAAAAAKEPASQHSDVTVR